MTFLGIWQTYLQYKELLRLSSKSKIENWVVTFHKVGDEVNGETATTAAIITKHKKPLDI